MSKKIDAIKAAVFYAQQNPIKLAEIIAPLVEDKATSVRIDGVGKIIIPASGNATENFKGTVVSQFGDDMTGTVTLALDSAVEGVSISGTTVMVASTTKADSFTLRATSGEMTTTKKITLVTE